MYNNDVIPKIEIPEWCPLKKCKIMLSKNSRIIA